MKFLPHTTFPFFSAGIQRYINVPKVACRSYGTVESKLKLVLPFSKYGGQHTVTLMSGDGIGPEMTNHVRDIFAAARVPVQFEDVTLNKDNNSYEDLHKAIQSIQRNGVALKGSVESEYTAPLFRKSLNAVMRVKLDLFVNVVHIKTYDNVRCKKPIDLVIIRQNTGGEYAMLEHESVPGVIECMKVIHAHGADKLGRFAFDYARENDRQKVVCIHKANIMKYSDGLFLETVESVAKEYPDISFSNLIVDNASMQMAKSPSQYQVIVAPNLYGLVLQNIAVGMSGGPGIYAGSNFGEKVAVFEPATRNTASDLDHNVANPLAMINASVNMLKHLRLHKQANIIDQAINETLSVDMVHTKDLGGTATTLDVVENIINRIEKTYKN